MNKKRHPVVIIFLVAIVCLASNIYWLLHKNLYPKPFITINVITGIFILIMIVTTKYMSKHK